MSKKDKRVLVVGAAGFLGRAVMTELRAQKVEAVGADVRPLAGVAQERIDLARVTESYSLVHCVAPDAIVNLAYMLLGPTAADPQKALEVNVLGVNGLFEAAVEFGVPRLVYASSVQVYGKLDQPGVVETVHRRPDSLYGWMKQLNEAMAAHYTASTETQMIGLRLASIQGRHRSAGFDPFDKLFEGVERKQDVRLPWRSALQFSFIHVCEAARALVALALADKPRHETYNSGSTTTTIGELGRLVAAAGGIGVSYDEHARGDIPSAQAADSSRLRDEFGLEWAPLEERVELELAAIR